MDTHYAARYHPILESFKLTPSFTASCDDSSWSNLDIGHHGDCFRLVKYHQASLIGVFFFFFLLELNVELYVVVVLEEMCNENTSILMVKY